MSLPFYKNVISLSLFKTPNRGLFLYNDFWVSPFSDVFSFSVTRVPRSVIHIERVKYRTGYDYQERSRFVQWGWQMEQHVTFYERNLLTLKDSVLSKQLYEFRKNS